MRNVSGDEYARSATFRSSGAGKIFWSLRSINITSLRDDGAGQKTLLRKQTSKRDQMKEDTAEMLYRSLGSTGERVSAIGVGGWHLGLKHVDEQLAIRIVRSAIDRGINFMDNCWDYNEGASEIRMGKALRDGYRDKAFLMTKIDGRSKKEATKQLEESLKRLQVDCIDLVQHHEIIRFEDPHRIFDEEGAHAALVEAREAGKLRYIGFHRTQGSAHSSVHARSRGSAGFQIRCRADAAESDGRALSQLCQTGAAGTGQSRTSACWA